MKKYIFLGCNIRNIHLREKYQIAYMLHKMHIGWQVCKCTMLTDWNTCQQVGHEKPYLYLLRIHNVNWEIEGSQHDVAVCVAVMRRYLRGAR